MYEVALLAEMGGRSSSIALTVFIESPSIVRDYKCIVSKKCTKVLRIPRIGRRP